MPADPDVTFLAFGSVLLVWIISRGRANRAAQSKAAQSRPTGTMNKTAKSDRDEMLTAILARNWMKESGVGGSRLPRLRSPRHVAPKFPRSRHQAKPNRRTQILPYLHTRRTSVVNHSYKSRIRVAAQRNVVPTNFVSQRILSALACMHRPSAMSINLCVQLRN